MANNVTVVAYLSDESLSDDSSSDESGHGEVLEGLKNQIIGKLFGDKGKVSPQQEVKCDHTDPPTGMLSVFPDLKVLQAETVGLGDLRSAFSMVASSRERYLTTLTTVLNKLTSPFLHGGVIFVVVDKEHMNGLQITILDNKCLNQVCQMKARKVDNPFFSHLLHAFCTPNETDRWEESLIDHLAAHWGESLKEKSPVLEALKMQPKDGAFVLSHNGTVLAAAAQLQFIPQCYKLCKANGVQFGTRHSAALATAEWMRVKNVDGIVFVRSKAGDVHVMLPHGKTLCKPQEYPWLGEDRQKLPLVLCIEKCNECNLI